MAMTGIGLSSARLVVVGFPMLTVHLIPMYLSMHGEQLELQDFFK